MTMAFSRASPLSNFRLNFKEPPVPGCETLPDQSDEYWQCYIRHLSITIYHPVGTCKMGSINDPLAVVDPHLR